MDPVLDCGESIADWMGVIKTEHTKVAFSAEWSPASAQICLPTFPILKKEGKEAAG